LFKRFYILRGAATTAGCTVATATSFTSYNGQHVALDSNLRRHL
jgi:hypothetical protein